MNFILSVDSDLKPQIRTIQFVVSKGHPSFAGCAYVTQIARRIKNATNYLIKNRVNNNSKPISHRDADKILKSEQIDLYRKMPSAFSQRSTQIVGQEWASFFQAIKAWKVKPSSFKAQPRPPGYAYKATTCHVGRNGFRVDNGKIIFADNVIAPLQTHFEFSQGWNAKQSENIAQEVRVVPKGSCFVIEVVYNLSRMEKVKTDPVLLDHSRKIGIDLGINNLLAIVSNQPDLKPVLVNGKHIKSINAWYNKRAAQLRSSGQWRHLQQCGFKRHRRIKDALHRASNYVRQYCQTNDVGMVVIGHNPGWKQEVNLGKVNNQKFVSIPHSVLIAQIKYKCEADGIEVIVREESYTSKACALGNDSMPKTYAPGQENSFSGRRVKRGLYRSRFGVVNADVNAAMNILRKETGDVFGPASRGVVFSPTVITLGSAQSNAVRRNPVGGLLLAA